ncbi:MAG: helix-turn-helix domain-containing protein [Spirochaetales bacterium]|nr:helix-turn-helix domain-containing protein [Spirochaetales bacterium]
MKFYRNLRGLSQEKLAEKANTATNYIALIETGRRFPSLPMLEKLALGLEVDAPELFSLSPARIITQKTLRKKILSDIDEVLARRLNEIDNK